tara:strand:- start:38 stop:541 length:504 start_codon:yes stop_codon:yes gene_type:complete
MTTGIRSNGVTKYPENPANSIGKSLRTVYYEKTIATGAGANRLHVLAGPMGYDDKINSIIGSTPALTSAADNDLGFWKKEEDDTFTAIDADILWDGVDLSSALSYRELLGTLNTSLDRDDNIGTLLGKTSEEEPVGGVYLGLYIQTASTAASEVLPLEINIEQANTK